MINKLSHLPLVELLRMKTRFELPKNLRDSIMLRGLEIELKEREGEDSVGQFLSRIEELENDNEGLASEKSDLEDKARGESERAEKLEIFLKETIADINVNILNGKKSITTLKKEFLDLRNAAQELIDNLS